MDTLSDLLAALDDAQRIALKGDLSSSLAGQTRAADGLLRLARSDPDPRRREEARTAAKKAIAAIGKLRNAGITAQVDPLSPERQHAVLAAASIFNGVQLPLLSETALLADRSAGTGQRLSGNVLINEAMRPEELSQTSIGNCSLIAGLIACWQHRQKHDSDVRRRYKRS